MRTEIEMEMETKMEVEEVRFEQRPDCMVSVEGIARVEG